MRCIVLALLCLWAAGRSAQAELTHVFAILNTHGESVWPSGKSDLARDLESHSSTWDLEQAKDTVYALQQLQRRQIGTPSLESVVRYVSSNCVAASELASHLWTNLYSSLPNQQTQERILTSSQTPLQSKAKTCANVEDSARLMTACEDMKEISLLPLEAYVVSKHKYYKSNEFQELYQRHKATICRGLALAALDCETAPKDELPGLLHHVLVKKEPDFELKDDINAIRTALLIGELGADRKLSAYILRNLQTLLSTTSMTAPSQPANMTILTMDDTSFLALVLGLQVALPTALSGPTHLALVVKTNTKTKSKKQQPGVSILQITFNGQSVRTDVMLLPLPKVLDKYIQEAEHPASPASPQSEPVTVKDSPPSVTEDEWFTWRSIACIAVVSFLTLLETLCAYRDIRKARVPQRQEPVSVYHQLGTNPV